MGDEGWALENRTHWLSDWARYCGFFFGELLPEAHSTKQHEDCVGWALEAGAETMLAYCDQPPESRHDGTVAEQVCRRVRCPVFVICGDHDMCQPPERARAVADLTGGELLMLEGAGHLPNARDPVKVNLEIERFVRRIGCAESRIGVFRATGVPRAGAPARKHSLGSKHSHRRMWRPSPRAPSAE